MSSKQLTLDFEGVLNQALAAPEEAEPLVLYDRLAPSVQSQDHQTQLQMAGRLLLDLAEVVHRKAVLYREDWEDSHNVEGPVLDEDFLSGLVQQSMLLDVSAFVRQPKGRRQAKPAVNPDQFFAEVDNPDTLLKELGVDEVGAELQIETVFSVIEEESVSEWVDAIAGIISVRDRIALLELREAVGLSIGKVWLGLLLGGFELHQVGNEFYDGKITASSHRSRA